MALQKYVPSGNVSSVKMKSLAISNEVHKNDKIADLETNGANGRDVDIDYREVYFLIMHFLSAGPCHRTFGQFWNELLENQLLPRRYHAWFSRNGDRSGDENDDGISFPLSYNSLVERYPHVEKDHLVKLLKQLVLTKASTPQSLVSGSAPNAADVPTLLGTGSFSLLNHDRGKRQVQGKTPAYMRWPHIRADQVRGLTLRELGGGFTRHHRSPSVRAASYCIAKPSTMVQKMQNIKRVRGHRNSVYCAILDRSGRYVVTGSDDRLVKIWSMETAFCLASCRGHEGDITDLAVTSNNTMVASASNDCVIRVWRLPDGLPVSVLRGHTGAVTTIAFSPRPGSAYQLLSSADDGTCRLWDVRAPQSSPRIYVPKPSDSVTGRSNGPSSISAPQSHQVFCCAFNASGTVFVTGSSDNLARVWNACKPTTEDAAEPIHEIDVLSGHENDVNYVQFSGCAVVSRANLIDIQKEDNVPKFRNSWFSHDNIVTCSRDGSAIIWIPRSRRSHGKTSRWTRAYHLKVPPPPMPPQPPRGGPRQRTLPTPRGVNMIVWSLDNRFVLAAIMDCRICVWNAADGSLVHCLTGHTSSTYVLDVHPSNPRIAMSAGYDGKLIVWDIWEGTPIRIYEISHFKLVDGKFSPDGTSIILSDDVGQLYILNTGQGESQEDAKYDQFFLGDYRPLIQDSYGNVLDQETQLVPYRRNMQDLLCDSGMIPYPEPYQSMYQKRRLGALGMEWKPSSIRFAAGPDFSLDPDYQMLPLADLDTWIEPLPPLPEFVDAMGWEPEIEIGSDSNDSEYNVMEEYSSGGDQGSVDASSTGELECSAEDSEVEDRDSYRRSKRKKQRAETEIMTSSGRRVKRRNLDEADDNSVKNNRPRKSKTDRKKLKKKSSKGNASRPRRAAARNALSLFSKITGTTSDGEDEEGSEGDFSESDSSLQDSDMGNDSDKVLGSEGSERRKGKDVIHGMSPDYAVSNEYSDVPSNPGGNRRKLVLRLPARDYNKMVLHESGTSKCGNMASFVGSSSKASGEGRQFTGIDANFKDPGSSSGDANFGMRVQEGRGHADNHHLDLLDGYRNGCDLRWKGTKIRSFKRQRLGGESSGPNESAISVSAFKDKEENLNGFSDLHQDNGTMIPALDVKQSQEKINGLTTTNGEIVADSSCNYAHPSSNGSVHAEKSLQPANVVNGNDNCSSELTDGLRPVSTMLSINSKDTVDEQENGRNGSLHGNPADIKQTTVSEASDHDGTHKMDSEDKVLLADAQIAEKSGPPQDNSLGVNYPKKTYTNVYRRAKSAKGKSKLESNGVREDHSKAGSDDSNTRDDLNRVKEGMANCAHKLHSSSQKAPDEENTTSNNLSLGHTHESDDQNGVARQDSVNGHILPSEEWASSSRTTVGLRSARNRKTSFYFRDTSPVERRKPQSTKRLSWLMLSMHEEGSRYIPQLGDEVVYLRQGHQEYIAYSGSREAGPWKMVKGCIRAVELCKVEGLEYATRAGSGDSCCKMILKFIDSTSDVFQKSFRFTLPEVTGFPDFLVEKTRFDVSMQRNWTSRDKCRVWWKNEGEEDGSWWDGRILSVKPKSSEFPDSPWEKYTIQYRSDPTETHLHSPWELFDSDTQWEQPCIDDKTRQKLLSALAKLEKSGKKAQDNYGVQKLRQVSQKSNFTNRFPVPLSLEVIQLRLENNYYRNMMAVRHDIEVMLSNAESYFGKNADVSAKIRRLSDWFEKTLSSL